MAPPALNSPFSKIYLAGFMGAGKSAVGPGLATRLGFAFVDTDTEIERRSGVTVAQIFAHQGEPEFRRLETEVLRDLAGQTALVVALGGGALMKEENRALVFGQGRVVYLRAGVEALAQRLRKTDRPLVREYQGEALKKRVTEMLRDREPVYQLADHILDTEGRTIAAVIAIICGKVS